MYIKDIDRLKTRTGWQREKNERKNKYQNRLTSCLIKGTGALPLQSPARIYKTGCV